MTFGQRMAARRKALKVSQAILGRKLATSASVIGRYERDEMVPSVETAKKIADALEVTVDYLLGGNQAVELDRKMMERLEQIAHLPEEDREKLFDIVDMFLRDAKARRAYAT